MENSKQLNLWGGLGRMAQEISNDNTKKKKKEKQK